jgi:hypothetical protein
MSEASHELDPVESALGHRAEQRELDEREPEWEAVARGELEVEKAVERRRAAGDDDETLERAAAYFRPFDDDETTALMDGLLAQVSAPEAEAAPEAEPEAEVVPLRKPAPAPPAEPPKPKHDPSTSGFWWIPGGMLLAAAAAIVMWWVWPPNEEVRSLTEEGGEQIAIADPLPTYVLETDGGLKELRGDSDGVEESGRHRYHRGTEFEWILRPKVDEPGEVAVRGFAFVDGGSAGLPLLALDQLAQIAKSGAVRIKGTIEQLDLEPGRYTIALAVGRPADLPTQAAEVHEPAADAAWQVRRIDIEIEE